MHNILITSAGQRVSLVKAFQQELNRFDSSAKVYAVDLNPILAPACHVAHGYKKVLPIIHPDYIENLLKICLDWKVKIVVPTIDTELLVLAKNRHLFLASGIDIIISDESFVKICRDKRLTAHFFQEQGIDVPKLFDKTNFELPVYIKPYDGSLSNDNFLINNQEDLTDYHLENEKLLFMEYIDHSCHEEYTVDTYYDKQATLQCVVPRKRIFVRAGEVNKGVTVKNEIVNYVFKHLGTINGARGCLTMQFFYNPTTKRIVAIEINPRFGGGYPLTYLAGANFPRFIIEEYLTEKRIEKFNDWEENLLMLRYDAEILVHNYEQ